MISNYFVVEMRRASLASASVSRVSSKNATTAENRKTRTASKLLFDRCHVVVGLHGLGYVTYTYTFVIIPTHVYITDMI